MKVISLFLIAAFCSMVAAQSCSSTISAGGAVHNCERFEAGSTCSIPCADGSTVVVYTCQSGSGLAPAWVPGSECPTPSGTGSSVGGTTGSSDPSVGCETFVVDSAGSTHDCGLHAVGDVCEYVCYGGDGTDHASAALTCTNSGWSPTRTCPTTGGTTGGSDVAPVCHGVLEVSFYARSECTAGTELGASCTVSCRAGYTGTPTAYTCTASGSSATWMPSADAIVCHSDVACNPACGDHGVCKASDAGAKCHCNAGWTGDSCNHNTFVTVTIALDGFDCSKFVLTDEIALAHAADVKANLVAVYNAEHDSTISAEAFDVSEVTATCVDGTVSFGAIITPVERGVTVADTVHGITTSLAGTSSAGTYTSTNVGTTTGASLSLNAGESGAVIVDKTAVAVSAASGVVAPAFVIFAVVAALF